MPIVLLLNFKTKLSLSEHVVSIIASMLRNCQGSQRQRLLAKFTENDLEKVDRLLELHFKYMDKVDRTEKEMEVYISWINQNFFCKNTYISYCFLDSLRPKVFFSTGTETELYLLSSVSAETETHLTLKETVTLLVENLFVFWNINITNFVSFIKI